MPDYGGCMIETTRTGRSTKFFRYEGTKRVSNGVDVSIGPGGMYCDGFYDSNVGIPGFTVPLDVLYEAMLKAGFRPEKHEKPDAWPY